jgi:hypothetical protein
VGFKKAARLRNCGDSVEARAVDGTADHVGAIAKPSSQPSQAAPLRAVLIGDTCTAAGLAARGAGPVLVLCRLLIEAGHDPARPLCVYRGKVLALTVRSIGEGAQLTVRTAGNGCPIFATERGCEGATASPARKNQGSLGYTPRREHADETAP